MLDKFRALPTDPSMLNMLTSSFFNAASNSHDHDPKSIFFPPQIGPTMNSIQGPHSDFLVKPTIQDPSKAFSHSNMFIHPIMANSFGQNNLMFLDKETSEEVKILAEDLTYSDSSSVDEKGNKRGKYKTYSEDEKTQIVNYMVKHGMQKTLEMYSGGAHKLTKRKLKGWLDGVDKVKGVKGRKSNDPGRDEALSKWCAEFQAEFGRPPSRKEATKKALELNADPSFMASKGWLDKFSKKFNIEFTSLKILPPRGTKKIKTNTDSKTNSASENIDSRNVSPLFSSASNLKELKPKLISSEDSKQENSQPAHSLISQPEQGQQPRLNKQAPQSNQNNSDVGQNLVCQDFVHPIFNALGNSFDYQMLSYMRNCPIGYYAPYSMQANLAAMSYQAELQENLQQLQKMMIRQQQENIKFDKC